MTEIESADITERLVGIPPAYLNKFVQQNMYGITASVQQGKLRAQRRLFSRDDVFAIALVWMLFESGLRTDPIRRILTDIAGTKKADAKLAAKKLLNSGAECLLILRTPRGPSKDRQEKPDQEVKIVDKADLAPVVKQEGPASMLAIPVGQKFADVKKRFDILFPGD